MYLMDQLLSFYSFSDTVLSYGRCNLINQDLLDDLDFYTSRTPGAINASPLGKKCALEK